MTYNLSYTVHGPHLLHFLYLLLYLLLLLWFYPFLSSETVSFAWWLMVKCRCSLCCDNLLWTCTVPDLRTARTYRHTARTYVSLNVCVCVKVYIMYMIVCVSKYTYALQRLRMCVCVCVCLLIRMYWFMFSYTYTYTYIYTYVHYMHVYFSVWCVLLCVSKDAHTRPICHMSHV